ncbi:hypothetical protein LEP1GSC021_2874 [Leptospira noguchii str. 1993005606]|nr:hypothetical protein LEP1GSC041_2852 [Leptospira noguchii str. 2006001870]EMI67355.1 hypothetical protein LEP1GSC072_0562 [Leptospira noguchii str. Bonito]EPE82195.1 hypothetical protein LEP1GSC021_2874 [Leptospira noguchii str. 1993005606]
MCEVPIDREREPVDEYFQVDFWRMPSIAFGEYDKDFESSSA